MTWSTAPEAQTWLSCDKASRRKPGSSPLRSSYPCRSRARHCPFLDLPAPTVLLPELHHRTFQQHLQTAVQITPPRQHGSQPGRNRCRVAGESMAPIKPAVAARLWIHERKLTTILQHDRRGPRRGGGGGGGGRDRAPRAPRNRERDAYPRDGVRKVERPSGSQSRQACSLRKCTDQPSRICRWISLLPSERLQRALQQHTTPRGASFLPKRSSPKCERPQLTSQPVRP